VGEAMVMGKRVRGGSNGNGKQWYGGSNVNRGKQ